MSTTSNVVRSEGGLNSLNSFNSSPIDKGRGVGSLFGQCFAAGVTLTNQSERLIVKPKELLDDRLRGRLREHKAAALGILADVPRCPACNRDCAWEGWRTVWTCSACHFAMYQDPINANRYVLIGLAMASDVLDEDELNERLAIMIEDGRLTEAEAAAVLICG